MRMWGIKAAITIHPGDGLTEQSKVIKRLSQLTVFFYIFRKENSKTRWDVLNFYTSRHFKWSFLWVLGQGWEKLVPEGGHSIYLEPYNQVDTKQFLLVINTGHKHSPSAFHISGSWVMPQFTMKRLHQSRSHQIPFYSPLINSAPVM